MKYCMVESLHQPFGEITCILPNPGTVTTRAIPWWGSGLLIIMGIIAWVISVLYRIDGLSEAARALVYLPLGNIFGMTQILLMTKQVSNGQEKKGG